MNTGQLKNADKVALFMQLFTGRTDVYGSYDIETGKCRQVKQRVDENVIHAHLCGRRPFGLYPLVGEHTRILAIDFDHEPLEVAVDCVSAFREFGLESYIEISKSKGAHVWQFFDEPVMAAHARNIAKKVLAEIGKAGAEIFPKQDKLNSATAYGNFINAPMFGRLAIKGRTVFLDYDNMPSAHDDQWAFLASVKTCGNKLLESLIEKHNLPSDPGNRPLCNNADNRFSLVPCARAMLEKGVERFQRVACYRLAIRLKQLGLPFDIAIAVLTVWAQKNTPDGGKRIITAKEIKSQTACAYQNNNTGFGCSEPAVAAYCDKSCPVYQFKMENRETQDG
ncbi:MAG: hypothetical protein DRP56_00310 [Planctomycetota bacterium]|nr:MAG: hypothetical protein DRP56_00310 [Planctomycetota bacterium]